MGNNRNVLLYLENERLSGFTRGVGSYVQRGSKFCFVVLVLVVLVVLVAESLLICQNTALLSNFTIYAFLKAFSILHHCMQPCQAALSGSFARQHCPAAMPGSLAQQPSPVAFQKYYKFNKRP
jgi:hypothetical protein